MSRAKPHCRNSLQRLRVKNVAFFALGSFYINRRALRPVLSPEDGNPSGQQTGLPVLFRTLLWQSAGHENHVEQHDGPRMRDGVAEASRQWTPCDLGLCKFDVSAKIVASLGVHAPMSMDVPGVTPHTAVSPWSYGFRPHGFRPHGSKIRAGTSRYSRASAHVSFLQICIRAEARRGSFPPSSLQHQTGPP